MPNLAPSEFKKTNNYNIFKEEILSKKQFTIIFIIFILISSFCINFIYFNDGLYKLKFLLTFVKPETKTIYLGEGGQVQTSSERISKDEIVLSNTDGDYLYLKFNKNLPENKTMNDFVSNLRIKETYIHTSFKDFNIPKADSFPSAHISLEKSPNKSIEIKFLEYNDGIAKGVIKTKIRKIEYVQTDKNYFGIVKRVCAHGDGWQGCPINIPTNINLVINFEFKVKKD